MLQINKMVAFRFLSVFSLETETKIQSLIDNIKYEFDLKTLTALLSFVENVSLIAEGSVNYQSRLKEELTRLNEKIKRLPY